MIAGSGAQTTSHVVSGLTNGQRYLFRVRAVNEDGEGGRSPAKGATPMDVLTVAVADARIVEGDAGQTEMGFVVTINGEPVDDVKLRVTATAGEGSTATSAEGAGQDFIPMSKTIVFDAHGRQRTRQTEVNDLRKTVRVQVVGDHLAEGDETFQLRLDNLVSNDARVVLAGGEEKLRATGVISDDDAAPVLSSMSDQSGKVGKPLSFIASATDADGDAIVYSWVRKSGPSLPQGTRLDTAALSFTPATAGTYVMRVTATDGNGNSASQDVSITVAAKDRIAVPRTLSVTEGTDRTATVSITTGSALGEEVTFSVSYGGTATGSNNPSGNDDYDNDAVMEVTFAANDTAKDIVIPIHDDNEDESNKTIQVSIAAKSPPLPAGFEMGNATTTITISDDDATPLLSALADVSLSAGEAVNIVASARDGDGDTISYLWSRKNGERPALPDNTDLSNARLSFTPTQAGTYTMTVTANDGHGNMAREDVVIRVSTTVEPAIVWVYATLQVTEGRNNNAMMLIELSKALAERATFKISYGGTATAGVDYSNRVSSITFNATDTINYILIPLIDDDRDEDNETITVTLTPAEPLSSVSLGDAKTTVLTIADDDATPVLAEIEDVWVKPGQVVSIKASATDADGDTISYAWTRKTSERPALPDNTDLSNARLSFTPTQAGTYTMTVTANDGHGNMASEDVVITVNPVEPATVWVYATLQVMEGRNNNAMMLIELSKALGERATFNVSYGGTATAGVDYRNRVTSITFNATDTINYILIPLIDDDRDEDNETITVTLSPVEPLSSVSLENAKTTVLTIADDDASPVLADMTDVSVTAGQAVNITASASDADGDTISYAWTRKASETPALPSNTDLSNARLSFTPTQSGTYTMTVTANDGHGNMATEDVVITVSTPVEPATVSLPPSLQVTEGTEEGSVEVIITASKALGETASFNISYGGTATADVDYDDAVTSISFNATDISKAITIPLTDDDRDEDNETITVTIAATGSLPAGSLGNATTTVTIVDDDASPVLADMTDVSVTAGQVVNITASATDADGDTISYVWTRKASETPALPDNTDLSNALLAFTPTQAGTYTMTVTANDGHGNTDSEDVVITVSEPAAVSVPTALQVTEGTDSNAVVTITSSKALGETATFNISYGGTATADVDYDDSTTSISFNATDTSKAITIPLTDDDRDEDSETITVILAPAEPLSTASLGNATTTVTIADDDASPLLTDLADVAVTAGQTVNITASATDADGDTISYAWTRKVSETPALPDNTSLSNALLAFTPTQAGTYTMTVTANDGHGNTDSEDVVITVSEPATLSVQANRYWMEGMNNNAMMLFKLSKALGERATFNISYGGTATAGVDYSNTVTSITFSPTDTTEYILIPLIDDDRDEDNETITVTLAPAEPLSTVSLGDAKTTVMTIVDDDASPVLADITDVVLTAGQMVNITASATDADGDTISYAWTRKANETPALPDNTALSNARLSFTPTRAGTYTMTVTANDGHGNTATEDVVITVSTPVESATISVPPGLQVTEGTDSNAVVTITSSRPLGETATFNISYGGTATADADYDDAVTSITFNATDASKAITIPLFDDNRDEDNETIIMTFTPTKPLPAGVSLGNTTTTVTIVDDDASPVLADMTDVSVTAGQAVNITASATDADGDTISYAWTRKASETPALPDNTNLSNARLSFTPTQAGTYTMTVTANDGHGNTDTEDVVITVSTTAPAKPTGVRAYAGTRTVLLRWYTPRNGNANITKWQFQQKEGNNNYGPWTDINGSGAATTSHTVTGLTHGRSYSFKLRAMAGTVAGATSDEVSATPKPITISVLTTLQVTEGTDRLVKPDIFVAGVPGERVTFNISYGGTATAGVDYDADKYTSISVNANSRGFRFRFELFDDNRDEDNETIIMTFTPTKPLPAGVSLGNTTTTVTIVDDDASPVLADMTDVSVTAGQAVNITASATDADGDTISYAWTRKASETPALPDNTNLSNARLSFTPTQAGTYTMTVTANDGHGNTDTEDVVITVSTTAPAKPTGVRAYAGTRTVLLRWYTPRNGNANITKWQFQQKEGNNNYGPWTDINGSGAATTSHTVTGLTHGRSYSFKLRAMAGTVAGATSDEVSATPKPITISVLTTLQVTEGTDRLVKPDIFVAGVPGERVTFNISYGGTATAGVDYDADKYTSISVNANSRGFRFRFELFDDNRDEDNETIIMTFTPTKPLPAGVSLGNTTTTVTIVDDDASPVLADMTDVSVTAGQAVNITASATDADGDTISYAWTRKASETPALPDNTNLSNARLSFTPTQAGTYTMTVTANDGHGNTDTEDVVITVSTTAPAKPTGVRAYAGTRTVLLRWYTPRNGNANITKWQFQQKEGNNNYGPWTDINGSGAATTSHTVTGLTHGRSYSFKLRAMAGTVAGATSDEVSATPKPITISVLTTLQVTEGTDRLVKPDIFVAGVPGERVTFNISYGGTATAGVDYDADKYTSISVNANSRGFRFRFELFDDNRDEDNETIIMTFTPTKPLPAGVSLGNTTTTVTIVDDDASPVLADMTDVSVTAGQAVNITASATDADGDTISYAWTRKASETPALPDNTNLSNARLSFTPTQAGTYTMTVTANDGHGNTDTEDVVITVSTTAPAKPTGVRAYAGTRTVLLRWYTPRNGNANITKWQFQQKEGNNNYGPWTDINGSGAATTSHTVTGLTHGRSYSFKLRAMAGTVAGATSDEVSATPKPITISVLTTLQVTEGTDRSVGVTIFVAGVPGERVTFDISYGGTATAGVDYDADQYTSISVNANSSSLRFWFELFDDNRDEDNETIIMTFTPTKPLPAGVSLGNTTTTVTIVDDDASPVLADMTDVSVTAGQAVNITASATDADGDTISYAWTRKASETPALPDNTNLSNARLSFTPTQAGTYTMTVTANDGHGNTDTEDVVITVSTTAPAKPTGVRAYAGTRTVLLRWYTPRNGNANITKWQFQQKEGNNNYGPWTDINGSGAATTSHTVTGLTHGRSYSFKLRAMAGTVAGATSDEVSATPKAPAPITLSVPTTLQVTEGTDRSVGVTISASKALEERVTFNIGYGGTATEGADYGRITSVRFMPTYHTLWLSILNDNRDEDNETITVTITPAEPLPTGVLLGNATTTITIIDDDASPVLADMTDVSVTAGQAVNITASATDADGDSISYAWARKTSETPALPDNTNLNNARLSFTPTQAGTYTMTVTANDGHGNTDSETVVITVTARSGDGKVTLSAANAQVAEGNKGSTEMVFNLTLDSSPTAEVKLKATALAGPGSTATATNGNGRDFVPVSKTVVFDANARGDGLKKTVRVTVLGDYSLEADETFLLRLDNLETNDDRVAFASGGDTLQVSGIITNDDVAGVSEHCKVTRSRGYRDRSQTFEKPELIPIGFYNWGTSHRIWEDAANGDDPTYTKNYGSFSIRIGRPANRDITLKITYADGSIDYPHHPLPAATNGVDYDGTPTTVTLPAGQYSIRVPFPLLDDDLVEGKERFTVCLEPTEPLPEGYYLGWYSAMTVDLYDDDQLWETGTRWPYSWLSVSNATVHEGPDAQLKFAVNFGSLTHGVERGPVYLKYTTRDRTAAAGADYTATSGTLHFGPGETQKIITVPVLDDAHDEGAETMELFILEVSGWHSPDKQERWTFPARDPDSGHGPVYGTGTIINTDPMPAAWLGRFGRTVADQALDAIADRIAAERTPGLTGSLAGQTLPNMTFDAANNDTTQGEVTLAEVIHRAAVDSRSMTSQDLLLGTAFSFTRGTDPVDGNLTFWGQAAHSGFEGTEDTLSLDGKVTTGLLGLDYARRRWMLGLAISHSTGKGGYTDSDTPDRTNSKGEIETSLTVALPYGSWQATEWLKLWGALGYGMGEMTLKSDSDTAINADLNWSMAAIGARAALLDPDGKGLALDLISDALWTRTASEKVTGLAATESDVTRLRLGLEGTWQIPLQGSSELVSKLSVGTRYDGGDAETGFGAELGGGITWSNPGIGLTLDVDGRTLLAHEADGLKDWGFSAGLAFDPKPATDRGFSLSLGQDWGGEATGGIDALFASDPLAQRTGTEATSRWTLEAAYGLPAFSEHFTGSPYVGLALAVGSRDYNIGWRLTAEADVIEDLSFDLKATRSESNGSQPEHRVGFELRRTW